MSGHHYEFLEESALAKPYHYTECGLDNIYLRNGFKFTERGGKQYVSVSNARSLLRRIGLDIISTRLIIGPQELKFLRRNAEMTQKQVADRLRMTEQQVANLEKGKSVIKSGTDVALRVMFLLEAEFLQPEGQEIAQRLFRVIEQLDQADPAGADNLLFDFKEEAREWAGRPMVAA